MREPLFLTRRYFLGQCTGVSLGALALGTLAKAAEPERDDIGGQIGLPHFAPKAKRVIFLSSRAAPRRWTCSTTSPGWALGGAGVARLGAAWASA